MHSGIWLQIGAMFFIIVTFLWVIRQKLLIDPAFYFVVLVYFVPFCLAGTVDILGFPTIWYQRVAYSIPYDLYVETLAMANISLMCFVLGYFIFSSNHRRSYQYRYYLSISKANKVLIFIFLAGVLFWLIGIHSAYGLFYYLRYFNEIRTHPEFEMESNSAFLIHIGRNLAILSSLFFLSIYSANKTNKNLTIISIVIVLAMVFMAAGRSDMIAYIYYLVFTWYQSNNHISSSPGIFSYFVKKYSLIQKILFTTSIVIFLSIAYVIAVSGRFLLSSQVFQMSISQIWDIISLQLFNLEFFGERLSAFSLSILHLSFVIRDVGNLYDFIYFRDIVLIPLYLLPRYIHGMNPDTLNRIFSDIYYPVRYGNFPPLLVTYLYWSLGTVGVVVGSIFIGFLVAKLKKICVYLSNQIGFSGIALFLAYQSSLLGIGYMSGIVKPMAPVASVIMLLFIFCKSKQRKKT